VCGIFLKHSAPALLSEAIRKVMAGETWIDQRCIRALVQAVEKSGEQERPKQLSGREREVLKGVFEGLTNKEIAQQLGISVRTVESHRDSLMRKVGIKSVAGLTRLALRSGLISDET